MDVAPTATILPVKACVGGVEPACEDMQQECASSCLTPQTYYLCRCAAEPNKPLGLLFELLGVLWVLLQAEKCRWRRQQQQRRLYGTAAPQQLWRIHLGAASQTTLA